MENLESINIEGGPQEAKRRRQDLFESVANVSADLTARAKALRLEIFHAEAEAKQAGLNDFESAALNTARLELEETAHDLALNLRVELDKILAEPTEREVVLPPENLAFADSLPTLYSVIPADAGI